MKYLKTYEIVKHLSEMDKKDLEIGDYVVLKMWVHPDDRLVNFINNNVGQILKLTSLNISMIVEYENVPTKIQKHFNVIGNNKFSRPFHTNEIEYHTKNIKELELMITTNKYNI